MILGNHRDAWGYGASDPSSGTAPLMEMARVLGERVRRGWRPRRSIVMASWAAEEAGLMGSWEWTMDKIHKLTHRAVGHINIDTGVSGDIPWASTSPSIKPIMLNAMKNVKSPKDDKKNIFEFLQPGKLEGNSRQLYAQPAANRSNVAYKLVMFYRPVLSGS